MSGFDSSNYVLLDNYAPKEGVIRLNLVIPTQSRVVVVQLFVVCNYRNT